MIDMLFYSEVADAFKFIFSEYKAYFQIGIVLFIISAIRKILFADYSFDLKVVVPLMIISEAMLYVQVGYGSYISLYTLKGKDYLPHLNLNKKLFFEGLKKTYIIYIYTLLIIFLSTVRNLHFKDDYFVSMCIGITILVVYCLMVLGLMNRYLHRGSFIQAFNIQSMYVIFKNFKIKNFALVLICVLFAQISIAHCLIPFYSSLSLNVVSLLISFFVSPAVLIFTKRLTALHIRQLFEDSIYSYKLE